MNPYYHHEATFFVPSPHTPRHPPSPYFVPSGTYPLQVLSPSVHSNGQGPPDAERWRSFPDTPQIHTSGTGQEAAEQSVTVNIHDSWRGRLAPLPGYRSRPFLSPVAKRVSIKPSLSSKNTPGLQLLPPSSQFGDNMQAETVKFENKEKHVENAVSTEKMQKTFRLDKYADTFVPNHLQMIQRETMPLKTSPPVDPFPPLQYIHTFFIPGLIDSPDGIPDLLRAGCISESPQKRPLNVSNYHDHWTKILRWELDAIAQDKEDIVLWRLQPTVSAWDTSEFTFYVPGIRENHPFLEIGDLVHMREVLPVHRRNRKVAMEGRIIALRKREGFIHVQSEPLKSHIQAYVPLSLENSKTVDGFAVFNANEKVPFEFNISFLTNARPLCTMQQAVTSVAKQLACAQEGSFNLARQWMFPETDDILTSTIFTTNKHFIKQEQWFDPGLNFEQRRTVVSIATRHIPVPHLVSGPPGTGKTRTVVEAVLQIIRLQPESCVLLCAPSNPATDTLLSRLLIHLSPNEMFRMNDPNRTFAEVSDMIKPYCYVENNKFSLPPWQKLMQFRVIVSSCMDANILVDAHCTNVHLMTMEREVIRGLHPHRRINTTVQPHWTHLLIDEAAQGSEPELLVPVSVMLPLTSADETQTIPQLTLCGDVNQLGPTIVSDKARAKEMEVSLLERLFERPPYNAHRRGTETKITENDSLSLPYTTLVKNYRSHPVILMPPSAIFYNDTLEPMAFANGRISWSELQKPHLPLKFIGINSDDESNDDRASWFNPGEIDKVLDVVRSLLTNADQCEPPLTANQIGIMAPWREQVWRLRMRLRKENLNAVDVGTVEDYQGRESRIIIISCVRSRERFIKEDVKKGMGVLYERKRMNVAITRAKELLVAVGNGEILLRDPYWKSFLQFTIRNGLYEGPTLALEVDGSFVSRLESGIVHVGASDKDAERDALILAGGVAREALRE